MADFNSKYTGEQVEELLDQVASGNAGGGGGGITVETDPIFSASVAARISTEDITKWNNKVDKDGNKQLSEEDFTTALKNKLESLSNYDDEALSSAVLSLQTQFNTLVSGNPSDAINSFNEIIAFLDGVKDSEDLDSIIASIEQQIAGKMDKVTLAAVATSGSYNDLADKPTIPAKLSELENDAEYVQRDPNTGFVELNDRVHVDEGTIAAYAFQNTQSKAYMLINSDGGITTNNSNDDSALKISVNGSGDKFLADNGKYKTVLTEHQDISNKQDKLVSGTSIKTINNTSLLGSGNITVATQTYVDSKIGDINTILESIIGGCSYYYGLAQYSEEELLNIADEVLEE